MKQVNIRELKANLSKYLKDLPVEITNHGVPVAWLVDVGEEAETKTKIIFDSRKPVHPTSGQVKEIIETLHANPVKEFVSTAVEQKKKLPFNGGPCFHKALPGMCRIDWCPNYGKPK